MRPSTQPTPLLHEPSRPPVAASRQALEQLRLRALERMNQGESPAQVAAALGMSRAWAYQCRAAARQHGAQALLATTGAGRPCKLTLEQQRQVFACLDGKHPSQCGLTGELWNQRLVRALIEGKLGVTLSQVSVTNLLQRLGLRGRRPLESAAARDPAALAQWTQTTLPTLLEQSRARGAEVLYWEHAAHTETALQRVFVMNAQGAFWFASAPLVLSEARMITLLRKLVGRRRRPICLVLDTPAAQAGAAVAQFIQSTRGRLALHFLPTSA